MFHVEQLNIKVFSLYSPVYTGSSTGTRDTSIYLIYLVIFYLFFVILYFLLELVILGSKKLRKKIEKVKNNSKIKKIF